MAFGVGRLITAAGQLYGGIASYYSSMEQASLFETQASLLQEQGRLTQDDYYRQAALVRDEGHRARAKQTMEYISAGVEAVGTPQLMARETASKYMTKSSALQTTGRNYNMLYGRKASMERRTARVARNEGRASLITGVLNAAGSTMEAFI